MNPTSIYAYVLGSYITMMILIGVYQMWKIETADDYLIAGRRVGFWQILGTSVATWSGSAVFIGFVGMGFSTGLSGFFYWVLPGCVLTIAFAQLVGRMLRRLRLYTIPDLFALRFGPKAAFIPAIFQIFIYSIPTLAIQLIGLGIVFNVFFGLDIKWGIFMSFGLISLYTIMGGMPSTILTDCLQAAIIVIGHVMMFVFAINLAGGMENIIENTSPELWRPFEAGGMSDFLSFALTVGPFYMVWQTTWQKIYSSKDDRAAVSGTSWGFVIALIIGLMSFFIGLFARGFLTLDTNPDLVFTTIVSQHVNPYAGSVVVLALTAAIMSGADSFTMMGSASIARDIYQQYYKPKASRREMLTISRCSVVFMSVAAVIVALVGRGIIPVYILVVKICGAGLVIPVLALLFWSRATRTGVLAGMTAGGVVTIGWHLAGNPYVIQAIPGYGAALLVTILVSLFTKHAPDEQVKAAFFEELDAEQYHRRFKIEDRRRKSVT